MSYHERLSTGEVGFEDPSFDPETLIDQRTEGFCFSNAYMKKIASEWVKHYGGEGDFFTKDQEITLAEKIQAGLTAQQISEPAKSEQDQHDIAEGILAERALVEVNMRFALYYARESVGISHKHSRSKFISSSDNEQGPRQRFIGTFSPLHALKNPHADLEDRYSMAMIGLLDAARKFKPVQLEDNKQARFTTYAAWSIQKELSRGSINQDHPGARLPDNIAGRLRAYFGDNPNVPEAHIPPPDIQKLIDVTSHNELPQPGELNLEGGYRELHDPWAEDDHPADLTEVWDAYDYDDSLDMKLLSDELETVFNTLSPLEATVIAERFGTVDGFPKTLQEIGEQIEKSRERARQLESKSMSKLRHPTRNERLRWHLEAPLFHDRTHTSAWHGDSVKVRKVGSTHSNSYLGDRQTVPTHELNTSSEQAVLKQERESWQAMSSEDWELPERVHLAEITSGDFDKIAHIFDTTAAFMYSNSYVERAKTPFPVISVEAVRDILKGRPLEPVHVAALWNTFMDGAYDRLVDQLGEEFNYGRIGQLFSRIIEEHLNISTELLILEIPEKASGVIDHMASGISHGEIMIVGNVGDHVASRNSGYSAVTVTGNAGNYAGSAMKENAYLTVQGNLGYGAGFEKTETAVIEYDESNVI